MGVRHNQIRVLIISNKESDKNRSEDLNSRKRVARALNAVTIIDHEVDAHVTAIVAIKRPLPELTASQGLGSLICPVCAKACKAAVGPRSHMRLHK